MEFFKNFLVIAKKNGSQKLVGKIDSLPGMEIAKIKYLFKNINVLKTGYFLTTLSYLR